MRKFNAAAAAGIIALSFTLSACGDGSDANATSTCPNGKIRMAVEPFEDPAVLTPLYQNIGKALSTKLDCPVEVQVSESYVAEILAMANGQLEVGQFGPLGYVFADKEAGAVPLVSFADEDGEVSSYTAGIWVTKDSDIKTVDDLEGRTLALGSEGSTSGDALPRQALIEARIDKAVETSYAGGHTEALLALENGQVDAAQINSQTLNTPPEGFKIGDYRKIWESEPILNDPITVSPDTSQEFQDAVKQALLELKKEDVESLGEVLDFTSPTQPLVEVFKDDYQAVFDLAETLGLTKEDL